MDIEHTFLSRTLACKADKHSLVHNICLFSFWQGDRRRACSSSRQRPERPGGSTSAAARFHTQKNRLCLLVVVGCLSDLNFSFVCIVQTLEELTDSYRTHTTELAKTVSQYSHTQQEVRQIRYVCQHVSLSTDFCLVFLLINVHLMFYNRTAVSELNVEVRNLALREREPTPLLSAHTSGECLSFLDSLSHKPRHKKNDWTVFFFWIQVLRHSHATVAEGSGWRSRTLTLKISVQPQAWPRSARMICHGWKTRNLVRMNAKGAEAWLPDAPTGVKVEHAESSTPRTSIVSLSQALRPHAATQTCSDNWFTCSRKQRTLCRAPQMETGWWWLQQDGTCSSPAHPSHTHISACAPIRPSRSDYVFTFGVYSQLTGLGNILLNLRWF